MQSPEAYEARKVHTYPAESAGACFWPFRAVRLPKSCMCLVADRDRATSTGTSSAAVSQASGWDEWTSDVREMEGAGLFFLEQLETYVGNSWRCGGTRESKAN